MTSATVTRDRPALTYTKSRLRGSPLLHKLATVQYKDLPALPLDSKEFPSVPAVYVISSGNDILYVGQTTSIKKRMSGHRGTGKFCKYPHCIVRWLFVPVPRTAIGPREQNRLLWDLETLFLQRYQPPLNELGVLHCGPLSGKRDREYKLHIAAFYREMVEFWGDEDAPSDKALHIFMASVRTLVVQTGRHYSIPLSRLTLSTRHHKPNPQLIRAIEGAITERLLLQYFVFTDLRTRTKFDCIYMPKCEGVPDYDPHEFTLVNPPS